MDEYLVGDSKNDNKEVFNDEFVESWSFTQINIVKFRHNWCISNFSFCCEKNGKSFHSPTFHAGISRDSTEWCLRLYPKGETQEYCDYVSLFLELQESTSIEISAKYKLGIVNAKGEDIIIINECHRFKINTSWGSNRFLKRVALFNDNNKILLDDKLTVFCEISAMLGKEHIWGTLPTPLRAQRDLAKDMAFLLESQDFSDVTLSAGGKDFRAHKLILAARSPVFRVMFQHDMEESKKNRVEIADIDGEALCEMLRYMYTGNINKLKEMAPRLMWVAKKYAMPGLKVTCEKAIMKSLTVDNAAEMFVLSDRFRAKELKEEVKDYIAKSAANVAVTPGFQSMILTHPHLGIEAFCTIRRKYSS